MCFIERSIQLIKHIEYLSFITPNAWLKNLMMKNSRKFFLENIKFEIILPNLVNVLKGASVDTLIFVGKNSSLRNGTSIYELINESSIEMNVVIK